MSKLYTSKGVLPSLSCTACLIWRGHILTEFVFMCTGTSEKREQEPEHMSTLQYIISLQVLLCVNNENGRVFVLNAIVLVSCTEIN